MTMTFTFHKTQDVSATDRVLGRASAGAGDVEEIACTAAGRALIDDADNAAQRETLGLGTIATQAADNVAITGGSVAGITDLAIADGGTGASTAQDARLALLPAIAGNALEVLRVNAEGSDVEWAVPSGGPGGGGHAGIATLSFGAFPGAAWAGVEVTGQAEITTDSAITAQVTAKATADHSAEEHVVESLRVMAGSITPGVGFTIYGNNTAPDSRLYGTFNVAWSWS